MSDLWLVVYAYASEEADVHVVAAPDERQARERVAAEVTGAWHDRISAESLRQTVMTEAQVERVRDGLHLEQRAEH